MLKTFHGQCGPRSLASPPFDSTRAECADIRAEPGAEFGHARVIGCDSTQVRIRAAVERFAELHAGTEEQRMHFEIRVIVPELPCQQLRE